MAADQFTLEMDEQEYPYYLTKRQLGQTDIKKSREFFCKQCECRVTRATDGTREYGHNWDCDHKIARQEGDA